MKRVSLLGLLWRWHRRIGLLAALFLLLMSVSGILLNHGADFGWDKRLVSMRWLRSHYGDVPGEAVSFALGTRWMSRTDSGGLYLDTARVGDCEGELQGAVELGPLLFVACSDRLLLLTQQGELVDSVEPASPLQAIALAQHGVAVRTAGQWQVLDPETLDMGGSGRVTATGLQIAEAGELPQALRARLDHHSAWLSWERLLLDLHSGRFFGSAGVWVVDILGVLLVLLALSGISMWALHRHARR